MTKQEYIDKFISLETCYELAMKHNDALAMSGIVADEIGLRLKMKEELTEEEIAEVNEILDSVLED